MTRTMAAVSKLTAVTTLSLNQTGSCSDPLLLVPLVDMGPPMSVMVGVGKDDAMVWHTFCSHEPWSVCVAVRRNVMLWYNYVF